MISRSKSLRNRYVVGDVHGCSKTLHRLVEDILKLTLHDTLYLLGDYIDRGPDSKGVLDYLMCLQESGYDIRPLAGNHEVMLLDACSDSSKTQLWLGNGGGTCLDSFAVDKPSGIPAKYISFLSRLPKIIVEDDFVIVHAGLDFRTDKPLLETPEAIMLWAREYRVELSKLEGRTLLCGHTMLPLFEIQASIDMGKPIICLDNGCWSKGQIGYGNLLGLNLDTKQLAVVPNCE